MSFSLTDKSYRKRSNRKENGLELLFFVYLKKLKSKQLYIIIDNSLFS